MTDLRATIRIHNRTAWDRQVEKGNQWTVPASPEAIAAARSEAGAHTIYLNV